MMSVISGHENLAKCIRKICFTRKESRFHPDCGKSKFNLQFLFFSSILSERLGMAIIFYTLPHCTRHPRAFGTFTYSKLRVARLIPLHPTFMSNIAFFCVTSSMTHPPPASGTYFVNDL